LNLAKGDFVTLEKDPKDKRVTRLSTTDKSKAFWQGREAEDKAFLLELFKNLSDQEKLTLHQSLGKLLQGTDELAERINREKEQCNE
jgi:DNA-binding MarR family transcriptional regulator